MGGTSNEDEPHLCLKGDTHPHRHTLTHTHTPSVCTAVVTERAIPTPRHTLTPPKARVEPQSQAHTAALPAVGESVSCKPATTY